MLVREMGKAGLEVLSRGRGLKINFLPCNYFKVHPSCGHCYVSATMWLSKLPKLRKYLLTARMRSVIVMCLS